MLPKGESEDITLSHKESYRGLLLAHLPAEDGLGVHEGEDIGFEERDHPIIYR